MSATFARPTLSVVLPTIYEEVKRRPLYILAEKVNVAPHTADDDADEEREGPRPDRRS